MHASAATVARGLLMLAVWSLVMEHGITHAQLEVPHPEDWRDIPVRVISLSAQSLASQRFVKFGFKDVLDESNKTVNMEDATPNSLYNEKLITSSCRLALLDGRRRGHELPSPQAVGVALSAPQVCSTELTTLVVEEDAMPHSSLMAQLPAALKLLQLGRPPDIVVFGPIQMYREMYPWLPPKDNIPASVSVGSAHLQPLGSNGFYGSHGVLYTPQGCKQARKLLVPPFDMQYDALIALRSQLQANPDIVVETSDQLHVWIEHGASSIVQQPPERYAHAEINGKSCCFCNVPSNSCSNFPYWAVVSITLVSCALVSYLIHHSMAKKAAMYADLPTRAPEPTQIGSKGDTKSYGTAA